MSVFTDRAGLLERIDCLAESNPAWDAFLYRPCEERCVEVIRQLIGGLPEALVGQVKPRPTPHGGFALDWLGGGVRLTITAEPVVEEARR